MIFIGYFSNTPRLEVLNFLSWLNQPDYEQGIRFLYIFKSGSPLYDGYMQPFGIEFYMHKLGHLTAYVLLTVFTVLSFKQLRLRFVILFVAMFAFADEIHQYYIVGRSGRLMDVALDTSFALIVLLLIRAKKRKQKQYEIKKESL
jgi:VanZ family protein